jgi:hypothetical protein
MIPDLVSHSDAQDGGINWIAYRHKESGLMFVNGPESLRQYGPHFTRRELHDTNGSLMPDVIATKNDFAISVVSGGETSSQNMDWDSISTHPDDIEVKRESVASRTARKKNESAAKAIMKGKT